MVSGSYFSSSLNSESSLFPTFPVGKIEFEKVIIKRKEKLDGLDLRGAIGITRDDHCISSLHKLIYIAQLANRFFNKLFGNKCSNGNIKLVHAEMNLGVCDRVDKNSGRNVAVRYLAHALFKGISRSKEDIDDILITHVEFYRPVDKKIRELFARHAEQTSIPLPTDKKVALTCVKPRFSFRTMFHSMDKKIRELFAKRVDLRPPHMPFSIPKMFKSTFHAQKLKRLDLLQRKIAFAATDLLLGEKEKSPFRDENGKLYPDFCCGYAITLIQGSVAVSQLSEQEQTDLRNLGEGSRKDIAEYILTKLKDINHSVGKAYQENDFMRLDPRYTMSYFLGKTLDGCTGDRLITFDEARVKWALEETPEARMGDITNNKRLSQTDRVSQTMRLSQMERLMPERT